MRDMDLMDADPEALVDIQDVNTCHVRGISYITFTLKNCHMTIFFLYCHKITQIIKPSTKEAGTYLARVGEACNRANA